MPDEMDPRYIRLEATLAQSVEGQSKAVWKTSEQETLSTGVHRIDLSVEDRPEVCEFRVPKGHHDRRLQGPLVTTTVPALSMDGPASFPSSLGEDGTPPCVIGAVSEAEGVQRPLSEFIRGKDLCTVPPNAP